MTRFSSSTTRAGSGGARNFERREPRGHKFPAYFFGRANLKLIKKQEKLWGGPGICFPGNFLKVCML